MPRALHSKVQGRGTPRTLGRLAARYDAAMRFEGKFGFHAVYGVCSPELLHEFEASLALDCLPADYRDFLLQWNGGRFDPSLKIAFPLQDQDDEDDCGRVFHFYGLFDAADDFDLRLASNRYGFRQAVPRDYIPIGDDYHWDQVCISTSGSDAGCVYWWTPGEPWPNEPAPTRSFLRPVAASFGEFWASLMVLP